MPTLQNANISIYTRKEQTAQKPDKSGSLSDYTLAGKARQRASKAKRSSIFSSSEDMLLFILIYLKNNPLQEYQAAQFGMSQPQANDWIHLTLGWLLK